ncbi:Flp family type IVb pilin [Acidiphilium acidophilum]|uniref:Flp family type IVb pilin n=1 Tax=Acidiphilium acidophilum TaxID=76588 RepID=UPI002E8E6D53|nr:Flp family type IVb pilin [Acidiphilium acidophilum]
MVTCKNNKRNSIVRNDIRAVTAIEYGLIAALIAVVIVGSLSVLGIHLATAYNGVRAGF